MGKLMKKEKTNKQKNRKGGREGHGRRSCGTKTKRRGGTEMKGKQDKQTTIRIKNTATKMASIHMTTLRKIKN